MSTKATIFSNGQNVGKFSVCRRYSFLPNLEFLDTLFFEYQFKNGVKNDYSITELIGVIYNVNATKCNNIKYDYDNNIISCIIIDDNNKGYNVTITI